MGRDYKYCDECFQLLKVAYIQKQQWVVDEKTGEYLRKKTSWVKIGYWCENCKKFYPLDHKFKPKWMSWEESFDEEEIDDEIREPAIIETDEKLEDIIGIE